MIKYLFVLLPLLLTSCIITDSSLKGPNEPLATTGVVATNTGIIIGTGSDVLIGPGPRFYEDIKGLLIYKNAEDFFRVYPEFSEKIDKWVASGSGQYVFQYSIVDKVVPYLYVCRMTLSGDEATIQKKFSQYGSIIPNIKPGIDGVSLVDAFTQETLSLVTLYDKLIDPNLDIPPYYKSLIQDRKNTIGTVAIDDCEGRIRAQHAEFFHED